MKKNTLLFMLIILVVIIVTSNGKHIIVKDKKLITNSKDIISMMIETDAGSGVYEESKDSLWPATDYTFNSSLSKCENGGTLTWDDANKKVIMQGNVSDKCYVYFDEVLTLTAHIKSKYTSQGVGGLYLHDSTLANGAGDNSYRYAGANPNNYVCFGSDVNPCPLDNQYRIIGVFGNQVKLIKNDYANSNLLGTDGDYDNNYKAIYGVTSTYKGSQNLSNIGIYYWNNSSGHTSMNYWNESNLNKMNLNMNYINKLGTKWTNKIGTTTWKVGGKTYIDEVPSVVYKNEIITPAENITYNAKVGLMYISDYGFAADPSAWTTELYSYHTNNIPSKNWMYMGLYEWTISRQSGNLENAFIVAYSGDVTNSGFVNGYTYGVRPVFYLTPFVTYISGTGTQNDPIIIN